MSENKRKLLSGADYQQWKAARPPADAVYERWAAEMMATGLSPEEFAARRAHGILCFGMDGHRYADPAVDAWVLRLGDILFRRNGAPTVTELREKYLTPEEIRHAEEIELNP